MRHLIHVLYHFIGIYAHIIKGKHPSQLPQVILYVKLLIWSQMSEYPSDWNSRRKRVYKRDNYRCQKCGNKGGRRGNTEVHAHHIKPKSKGGSHRLSNLTTLCKDCHNKVHSKSYTRPISSSRTTSLPDYEKGDISDAFSDIADFLNSEDHRGSDSDKAFADHIITLCIVIPIWFFFSMIYILFASFLNLPTNWVFTLPVVSLGVWTMCRAGYYDESTTQIGTLLLGLAYIGIGLVFI